LISAGSQKAGAITGTGITQVNSGATLTAKSIVQDTLIIGGVRAANANQVPEPSSFILLLAGGIGAFVTVWRWRHK
jgi:hypothetical protein